MGTISDTENLVFIRRTLAAIEAMDERESVWWRVDCDVIRFYIICNDWFWWGTSDLEEITSENVQVLEESLADVIAALDNSKRRPRAAALLFCSRVRKMRPQGAAYTHIDTKFHQLFNACGPPRDVDICNPEAPKS